MKYKNSPFVIVTGILLALTSPITTAWAETPPTMTFSKVEIAYPSDECSFKYSPVDFCDNRHIKEYNLALQNKPANFNSNYILLPIKEWDDERSLVAIDKRNGIVYPVPIDSYFDTPKGAGTSARHAKLNFSKESNEVCISGSILVYRANENGKFCFRLEGNKFVGHHTTYMGHDTP
ncbi:hypothetical protein [Burkholderia gladioli]|uniref:hypothetical protein n=1 Tax=Burkholderia gladioli TaxID=28095 RepID=UPI001A98EC45|nr:hypothetical protein [Burkholderia gladioli]